MSFYGPQNTQIVSAQSRLGKAQQRNASNPKAGCLAYVSKIRNLKPPGWPNVLALLHAVFVTNHGYLKAFKFMWIYS